MIHNNNLVNNKNKHIFNLQNQRGIECITIGRLAPDFIALSTHGYVRLSDYRGKWMLLASYPFSFGSVSTTEVISLAQEYNELEKRNVQVLALTTDSNSANLAWAYDIYQKTGITIPFPIIDDTNMQISEMYGMLNPDRMYGETVRNSFLINPEGRIKSILILPISCGRSGKELLRIIDSLQITEEYNLQTPANWNLGDPLVLPVPNTYEEILEREVNQEELNINCPFWYVCYQDMPETSAEGPR
ncbi:redoxin domain-containing protein [Sedimentibacter sp.]|uniref:peroxiredoxin n=1 Tax=Sedimentibacter sp. TaxID=1960295 RepID=UPI0028B1B707|nr:redoxin domain-containing protein [Sedimentibacter sp.]